jgi:hypothetical protein
MKLIKVKGIEKDVYRIGVDAYYCPDDNKLYQETDDGFRLMPKDDAKKYLDQAAGNVKAFQDLCVEIGKKLCGEEEPGEEDKKKKKSDFVPFF